jgi:hypothetical protein
VAVIVLGFANFLAFFAVSAALGGDALNGHVTDGHYFVASHGTYTEVSQAAWTASRIDAIVTLLSWPLVMLSMAFLLFRYVFPFMTSGKAPTHASARVAALRSSGALLWQGWPGGVAGSLTATAGVLGAEVYPGGIVVKPRFMSASAIQADEIRAVRLGRRVVSQMIEVEHAGIDVTSPLILYGGPDSPQARALLTLGSGERQVSPPADAATTGSGVPATPSSEAAPRPVPGPMRALGILGLVVAAVMIVAGVFFVIPSVGPFGVVWTGMAALILVINGRRFIRRGW